MTLNGNAITIKLGIVISLLTLIFAGTMFGISQIQAKVDRDEVKALEVRCEKADTAIRMELLERIKEISGKQDDTNKLLQNILLNKKEK